VILPAAVYVKVVPRVALHGKPEAAQKAAAPFVARQIVCVDTVNPHSIENKRDRRILESLTHKAPALDVLCDRITERAVLGRAANEIAEAGDASNLLRPCDVRSKRKKTTPRS
jgi:hypothetical protein